MIHFVSDTHFGHRNIIKYCNRPFQSTEEMEEAIVANWNSVVSPKDTVYHLGDFLFAPKDLIVEEANRLLGRLNGEIHILWGNHDKVLRKNQKDLNFKSYSDLKTISCEGQKIVLCHYRLAEWDCKHHGAWHLWGHSHGSSFENGPKDMDVGVDPLGFFPISFEQLKEKFTKEKE